MNFLNIEYSGNCFFENNSNIRDIFYHKPEDLHIHFMEFIDSKKVSRYSREKYSEPSFDLRLLGLTLFNRIFYIVS